MTHAFYPQLSDEGPITDDQIQALLDEFPDAWAAAEACCDHEASLGRYEGCSTELELAFSEYENRARELLSHREPSEHELNRYTHGHYDY